MANSRATLSLVLSYAGRIKREQWGLDHPIWLVLDQGESQRDQARHTRAFKQRAAGDPASIVCPFMELAKSRALGREGTGLMSETGSEMSEVKSQYLSAA